MQIFANQSQKNTRLLAGMQG